MKKANPKSNQIIKFFVNNPTAIVKDVAAKFKVPVTSVYPLRKRAMKQAQKVIAEQVLGIQVEEPITGNARDRQVGGDHYKAMGIEPWDVVDTWPIEQRVGYYRGNAVKYLMRMGTKDMTAVDVGKAQHYMQKLLEVLS
jgi:hypothetical protein